MNLDSINDLELIQEARGNLLGNEDIMRVISKGNPDIVDLLSDPDLAPQSKDINEVTAAVNRLAAKYGGGVEGARF